MTQFLKKDPEADLRLKYRKTLEISTIFALLIMIFTFYAFKEFEVGIKLPTSIDIKIEVIDIPPTEQIQRPPPPARPAIPIESEDDELLDDVTIDETDIVFEVNDAPPPPPPDDDEVFEFFAVSEKPSLIKKAIPKYPDLARKAQIEGKVVITVTIDKKGIVENAIVFKSVPMLDEAAQKAALQCTFKPAKQRDKFVKVKMNIPFDFHLR
jgi:protein TonB